MPITSSSLVASYWQKPYFANELLAYSMIACLFVHSKTLWSTPIIIHNHFVNSNLSILPTCGCFDKRQYNLSIFYIQIVTIIYLILRKHFITSYAFLTHRDAAKCKIQLQGIIVSYGDYAHY